MARLRYCVFYPDRRDEMQSRFIGTSLFLLLLAFDPATSKEAINYSREILPILSENCFSCHGPDESHRKANLRLDIREDALKAISPGKPANSELITRLISDDPSMLMPPKSSHKKPLTKTQIELLSQWITEGAVWGKHWAFERPVKKVPPGASTHPIDGFIRDRLAKEDLKPSPRAKPHQLAKRLSFDLTGLPPSKAELAQFLKEYEENPVNGYQQFVDRLLASEHFGERLAMWWLDAARYSDTDGFQGDDTRTNWPWRDWVIDAFNRNLPFDQFTIEQFAGDLLPKATPEQRLATAFHRNHMTNGEGGRDPEESRTDYVIDRVSTVGTVWLGLTLGCCQCHSHKFDPISQKEFYSLSAFFNSIDEDGKAGQSAKPYLPYASSRVQRAILESQQLLDSRKQEEVQTRELAKKPFDTWLKSRINEANKGHVTWHPLLNVALESAEGTQLTQEADGSVQASGDNPKQDDYRVISSVKLPRVTGIKLEILPHATNTQGALSRGASGEFILTDIKVQVRRQGSSQVRDVLVSNAVADVMTEQKDARGYGNINGVLDDDPRNGWTTKGHDPKKSHTAVFGLAEPLRLEEGERLVFVMLHRSTVGDANVGRFRVSITDQAGPAVRTVGPSPMDELATFLTKKQEVDAPLRGKLFEQFLSDYEPYQQTKRLLARAEAQLKEAQSAKQVNVMVLAERPSPRETNILLRGVWDKKGPTVERDVPLAISPWKGNGPRTREELAKWIVSPENPLTSRVIVNHLWQLIFGAGIVRTPEDFGLLGERPTHPELLDWLAVDFVEHGWDVKRLLKLMVTSETYQQDSVVSENVLRKDPHNRWLARSSRQRLPSWMLRDAALKSSGLLNPAIGGPPVRPFQPEGVWEEMFMGRFKYQPSDGPAQYRRTIYTFWRRAIAPTFLFDAPQRRTCEVRTTRTNTPLHALTLLNDSNYLVASRELAKNALKLQGDVNKRLAEIGRRVLSRELNPNELAVLRKQFEQSQHYYMKNAREAEQFLRQLPNPLIKQQDSLWTDQNQLADLVAYTIVSSLVLNLDEAINRE